MWIDAKHLIDLTGKNAVVTGAGRGIGWAIARRLGHAGARVTLTDVDPELEASVAELTDEGLDVTGARLDVTDPAQHDALVGAVTAAAGPEGGLDIWVNNAGIYPVSPVLELSSEDWHAVLRVNLDGAFYGSQAAGRAMTARGSGVIVNMSSASGFRAGGDGRTHYAASKAGVNSLTRSFARELGPAGIRVVGIAPTATRTSGITLIDTGSDEATHAYQEFLPLRRIAAPDDIARVALFCVSGLASLVTGTVIPVDAGQLAI